MVLVLEGLVVDLSRDRQEAEPSSRHGAIQGPASALTPRVPSTCLSVYFDLLGPPSFSPFRFFAFEVAASIPKFLSDQEPVGAVPGGHSPGVKAATRDDCGVATGSVLCYDLVCILGSPVVASGWRLSVSSCSRGLSRCPPWKATSRVSAAMGSTLPTSAKRLPHQSMLPRRTTQNHHPPMPKRQAWFPHSGPCSGASWPPLLLVIPRPPSS